MDHHEVTRVLGSTPLFASLEAGSLAALAKVCVVRNYQKGQYVWYQGDAGDRLLIVATGLVKVMLTSAEGEQVVLATLSSHQTAGELALLDGSPRSASLVTIEPTTALIIGRPAFVGLLKHQPEVLDALLSSLGALVRRLTELTGDLVFLDLGGRLAKLMLRLSDAGEASGDRVVIDLRMSQSDLAAMVGATRPAVNRVLQLLAARGLISVDGPVIELRDLPGLRRRAGI